MFDDSRSPFGDPQGNVNPFTDESVRSVTIASPVPTLADFNPFINDRTPTQPAVSAPHSTSPVAATPSPPVSHHVAIPDELTNQQWQLERSVSDIDREQQLDNRRNTSHRINNFPPLPSCCPLKPCFFQDFDVDIPAEYRRVVKIGFFFWILYTFTLFVNVIGALTYFIVVSSLGVVDCSGITFGLSIGYFIVLSPLAFICWYRPLYKAFRSDSSANFFVFFFIFAAQFAVMVIGCLGTTTRYCSGWVGYFSGFNLMGAKLYGVGAFMLVIGVLFTILAIFNCLLLAFVMKLYRRTGATFQKAQEEFQQGVRSTAAPIGAVAVRNTIDSRY